MENVPRILVIEDDELYATMLAEQLGITGHSVTVACDLAGARQHLLASAFDVIVADLHLPDTDGGISGSLLDAAGHIPVLLITGTPSIESALQSLQRRVFAYRVKPFEMAAFRETVAEAVAFGRLQRRLAGTRRRYQSLDEQLDALRQVAGRGDTRDINQSLSDYLRLLLGSSMESLGEALDILGSLEREQLARPVRQLSRHPEAEMFRAALTQAIEVLEKTRNTFKSKELGDLRRRLELALKLTETDRR